MPEINPFRDRLELTSSRILKIISIGSVKLKLIHFWKNHFRIFIVPIRLVLSGYLTLVQLKVQKIWDCPPKFHPNNFHPNPISLNSIGTIVQLPIFLAMTLSVPSKKFRWKNSAEKIQSSMRWSRKSSDNKKNLRYFLTLKNFFTKILTFFRK